MVMDRIIDMIGENLTIMDLQIHQQKEIMIICHYMETSVGISLMIQVYLFF